ncbi:MAG: HNH endonuclease family protein [Nitrosomonas sp.]|nr:HNH endonuclease family protein [Nitrosomonas sp.]
MIFVIAILIVLSGCAIEKRTFPVTQQPTTVYSDPVITSTPYNRDDWGDWIDVDGDCQDTRQEILIAASRIPVQFKDSRECTAIIGEWYGAYTGNTFTKASDLDIDHIVPLAHAHRHGAENWTKEQREIFANDFENLIAVSNSANRSKGDKSPHEWLPPLESYWCEYGKRWKRIKDKYRLWYSQQERLTLDQLAGTCLE